MSNENDVSEADSELDACTFVSRTTTFAESRFALGVCLEGYHVSECPGGLYVETPSQGFIIDTQVVAGSARYDFVFFEADKDLRRGRAILVVEIDDPSHWRDPNKSVADKVRDRVTLRSSSAPTMRFSNDELSGAGFRLCAREALLYVHRFLEEREGIGQSNFSSGFECGKKSVLKELESASKEEKALLS